jgi:xanthine dehydrogenase accessory factor
MTTDDPTCAVAHGAATAESVSRTLVAVFASPVAEHLLRYAQDLGFRTVLVDPERGRVSNEESSTTEVLTRIPDLDETADVVMTDHHRVELGPMLAEALKQPARWIGVLGKASHVGPHVAALRDLGVADDEIARVHRPVGLNIGSRTPPEIAISTLAGLIADRNGKPGGFEF